MEFHTIAPLWQLEDAAAPDREAAPSGSLFSDIFQAAVDQVKETEAAKNDAEYRLATGQMDNPAEWSILSSQWSMSVELLVQLRNSALDAYSELMRISL